MGNSTQLNQSGKAALDNLSHSKTSDAKSAESSAYSKTSDAKSAESSAHSNQMDVKSSVNASLSFTDEDVINAFGRFAGCANQGEKTQAPIQSESASCEFSICVPCLTVWSGLCLCNFVLLLQIAPCARL